MGAIEEVYADLEADVSEEQFREAVEAKVEQMGGLADEETAAMLVAHELADNEVTQVADVEAGMEEVKFLAKVLSVGELRTFERDGEDEDGRVINVEAADESGTVRLAFWDDQAVAVDEGELDVGEVLRIKGRPKEGYNGLEVSVDKAEPDDEADIDIDPGGGATVETLTLGQSDVTLTGLVLGTDEPRTFERDDGTEGSVANLTVGDETGRVRVTLWDEMADRATELAAGDAVEIVDGYVRERDGDLELHVGDGGAVRAVDEPVEYQPEATPIAEVELDDTVDLAGVVRETDPKRTFDRDDGSEGQVRNLRIQDDSGDTRVALWGDLADLDVGPGDEILAADVEIQDGWQDDLEASAGWRSTVVVLDEADTDLGDAVPDATAPAGDAGGADGGSGGDDETGRSRGDDGKLSAFAEGGDGGSAASDDGAAASESASGGGGGAAAATVSEGESVEFTGTVVQTGQPVIIDDGTETMTVETDETLQLGEEVTARGQVQDGTLVAEELF